MTTTLEPTTAEVARVTPESPAPPAPPESPAPPQAVSPAEPPAEPPAVWQLRDFKLLPSGLTGKHVFTLAFAADFERAGPEAGAHVAAASDTVSGAMRAALESEPELRQFRELLDDHQVALARVNAAEARRRELEGGIAEAEKSRGPGQGKRLLALDAQQDAADAELSAARRALARLDRPLAAARKLCVDRLLVARKWANSRAQPEAQATAAALTRRITEAVQPLLSPLLAQQQVVIACGTGGLGPSPDEVLNSLAREAAGGAESGDTPGRKATGPGARQASTQPAPPAPVL